MIALIALFFWAPAWAQKPLELGTYSPRLHHADSAARTAWARKAADALAQATGLAVNGRAFARAHDLRAYRRSGRLHLALIDVAAVIDGGRSYLVLGRGSGPRGAAPTYAVLGGKGKKGLNACEGKRLGLLDTGPDEVAITSNHALEGEIAIDRFFSKVLRAGDVGELEAWVRTGRVDCMLGYSARGSKAGLGVVAPLAGMPLPLLVEVDGRLDTEQRFAIQKALKAGIPLPPAGPLRTLVAGGGRALDAVRQAARRPPGQRAVRRAVWSPGTPERLAPDTWRIRPRGKYPLPKPLNRWRIPDFPEVR